MKTARTGQKFTRSDVWLCRCGQSHEFSEYAKANWLFGVVHDCPACGHTVQFMAGLVVFESGIMRCKKDVQHDENSGDRQGR